MTNAEAPMTNDKIVAIFDQHATTYDQKWSELAPINASLHLHAVPILRFAFSKQG